MKNKIIQGLEDIVNSPIESGEKIDMLIDIQEQICKKIELVKNDKVNETLDNYLKKYKKNQSCDSCNSCTDDFYTLESRYKVDREHQDLFALILSKIDIDGYGSYIGTLPENIEEEYKKTFNEKGYENDVFYIRPYNWDGICLCDCSCGLDDKLYESGLSEYDYGYHSKNCVAWETNFYYKPTGLKIAWYKYPLRSAYANQNLDGDTIEAILNDCVKSVTQNSNIQLANK